MARERDKRRESEQAEAGTFGADERFNVPGADILSHDTWADEPERCPNCDRELSGDRAQCPGCGQWLERCGRSCPSCASPRCVGGLRSEKG